jgi:hypothetical protein
METWEIRTIRGSLYWIHRHPDGRWWVSAKNLPTPDSCSLAHGCWEIRPPVRWPPSVGRSFVFEAPHASAPDDPNRIPGGGKITSEVVAAERLEPGPCAGALTGHENTA